jgi:hypothetical protein
LECARCVGCWLGIGNGWGWGGEMPLVWIRDMAATSIDCDRFSCLMN